MNEQLNQQLGDWLDHVKSDAVELNGPIDGESRRQLAESLVIHGLLSDLGRQDPERDAARIGSLMKIIDSEPTSNWESTPSTASPHLSSRRFALLTSALTIAATVLAMIVMFGPHQNVSAALASLDHVLEAAALPFDRSYEVRVVEEYAKDKLPHGLPQQLEKRKSNDQIDGATLSVRGADKYVFTRRLKDGGVRVSGCDGQQRWAFRDDGPIHVSSDLSRFRGGVPGQQQDIPFINLYSHLTQLRTGYDIELQRDEPESSEVAKASGNARLYRLIGIRKSREVQGPKQMEIWFSPENGTVYKMLLDGLPRGGGGPKSVSLELVSQNDLGPNYFSHQSHHELDREIRHESSRP